MLPTTSTPQAQYSTDQSVDKVLTHYKKSSGMEVGPTDLTISSPKRNINL